MMMRTLLFGAVLLVALIAVNYGQADGETVIGSDDAVMILIPAGEFGMSSVADEGKLPEHPAHMVYLGDFYMDVHEVTNAQYARFLNEYGKHKDEVGYSLIDISDKGCMIEKAGGIYKPKAGYEDHPAAYVSWYGAVAYAHFYGKRLPTELEWEKAARGGLIGKKYSWGDEEPDGTQCNFADKSTRYSWVRWDANDSYEHTAPVGSFLPNGYGLYDMAGNVWEWCACEYRADAYNTYPKSNPNIQYVAELSTSISPKSLHVMRGGSWRSGPNCQRVARRTARPAYVTYQNVGFRCVKDSLTPEPFGLPNFAEISNQVHE